MPYINVKTTGNFSAEEKINLSHELAQIIELVPGKSEEWVMTSIEGNLYVSFGGTADAPAAAVTVSTFGALEEKYYKMLTDEICTFFEQKLGIPANRTYVMFQPITQWGWNHEMF